MASVSGAPRAAVIVLCGLLAVGAPGCATVAGFVSGAFTGAIDAPAQVYRKHRSFMDHHPIYWVFNVLFVAPMGFLFGPLVGAAKGLALDIHLLLGRAHAERVFATYRNASVWRPYTIHW